MKHNNASARVVAALKERIASGALRPGDRLPSERALAEQLGVSRASVREGLQTMLSLGVFQSRHGSGTVVAPRGAQVFARPIELLVDLEQTSLAEIYETRRVVETGLARLAAGRRSEEQLSRINVAVRRISDEALPPADRADANWEFHAVLAEMSGNRMLACFMDSIKLGALSAIELTNTMAKGAETAQVHRAIAAAIERQDPDEAEKAVHRHMDLALAELAAWEREKDQ